MTKIERSEKLQIRASAGETALWKQAAAKRDKTLSEWIRRVLSFYAHKELG